MHLSVGLVVSVIVVILAIAAVEVAVLLVWRRRRQRRLTGPGEMEAWAREKLSATSGKPRRNALPILAIVFTSIGLLLGVAVAGISAAVVASSISGDRHADGTVVELSYNGRSYNPVVEFTTPRGARIRFSSWVGSNPPAFHDGEHVGVRYNPDNPEDAEIDDYWQIWFVPTLFGIIGSGFLLIGAILGVVTLVARLRRSLADA